MKEQTIKLAIVERGIQGHWHILAVLDDSFPGLAVHPQGENKWTVTHIRSGKSVTYPTWGYDLRAQAIAYARHLAMNADWTQDKETIGASLTMPLTELVRRAQLYANTIGR